MHTVNLGERCTNNVDADEVVTSFVDRYISCEVPENDPELAQLGKTCRRITIPSRRKEKGQCRFNFPRPPTAVTILAKEPEDVGVQRKKGRTVQRKY